ncbi:hypothetical protein C1886_23010 [Pseudomonas sp. FW300-N1A1]|uniref:hypothetical protein n=1 Tax=Pseudomonas sp. FW300-N1A1 TaxID=2075555 RepID=UPI000CD21A8E|nr:hypothetical protein [Pseudomonas sp. FW300-N1A1]POA17226.1 hypothetical protein C1886_23010 [Pseudomonas sp. FW300-N1A1]
MEPFTPLSIRTYLVNLGDPSIGNPESMQARQLLGYLTSANLRTALSAVAPHADDQWADGSVLPLLLNLKATHDIVARATGLSVASITPAVILEVMYQLATAVWQDFADRAVYPHSFPDLEARRTFKSNFIALARQYNHSAYTLNNDQIALLASILDSRHIRSLQQAHVDRLLGNRYEQIALLSEQPTAPEGLLKLIGDLIANVAPTLDPTTVYAMVIHAAGEDDPALIAPDATTRRPSVPLLYNQSVAQLASDVLHSGARPHLAHGQVWKSLWISLYQDLHVQQENGPPSAVSCADLLKEGPVNYNLFMVHAFLPVSRALFDRFIDRLLNLRLQLLDNLKQYWSAPIPGVSRKQVWSTQNQARLLDATRLGVLDGTLDTAHHGSITAATQDSASTRTYTLSLKDEARSRSCKLNRCWVIAPAQADTPDVEPLANPIICFTPDKGLQVFANWKALTLEFARQLCQAEGQRTLINYLARPDAMQLADALRESVERVSLQAHPIARDLFSEPLDATLAMQDKNLEFAFETGKGSVLDQGLSAFLAHLDSALETTRVQDFTSLVAERNQRLIEWIPDQQLFDAWSACRNQSTFDGNPQPFTFFDMPPLKTRALSDDERRQAMLEALASPRTITHVREVLNRTPHYFAEGAITPTLAFSVIEKVYRHELGRLKVQWEVPDSRRYKCFVMEQQLASHSPREQARHIANLISLNLLGLNPAPSESVNVSYSSTVLDEAQARVRAGIVDLHPLIAGSTTRPDVDALCNALQTDLVYPGEAPPSPHDPYRLTHGLFLELLCDFPGFHRLERALDPDHRQPAAARRAMALTAITDYLEPATTHQPGYICGLNLMTVTLGEHTHPHVRKHLQQHLKTTFAHSTARSVTAVTFALLAARHAPELLVQGVPDTLLFGQTLSATQFRHAVALAEQLRPDSALTHTYQELMDFYTLSPFERLPEHTQLAVAVSGQHATLHFAMCRGVIPQVPLGQVSHDQTLAALLHVQRQQQLEARTFTQLAQVPPVRKAMAMARLKSQPELDLQRKRSFTESEVQQFFVKGYLNVGRHMHMTLLEHYMTCGAGRSFDYAQLGFVPDLEGGCALQAAFDEQYQDFKKNYLQGLVSRMALALHDLPALDRDRILDAYKFITVSFNDPQGQRQTANHGLIALYKKDDQEYAYEIFCPSGTIRLLERNGTRKIRINAKFSPPTADYLYHESPYLTQMPDLDQNAYLLGRPADVRGTPELDVSFYTVARQVAELDRDGKIQFLSQKMVDNVFGKAVEQAYDTLREPTPYERYRENLLASNERLAAFFVPGYSIYQDISRGTVTPGTFLFAGLEALSYLIPFGSAVLHAMRAYLQVARLVVRSTSFGVSRLALKAAQTAQGAREFSRVLAMGFTQAANPLGPAIFLFQGGIKGVALVRAGSRFVRGQLHASRLASGLNLPPLGAASGELLRAQELTTLATFRQADSLAFFKPDLSTARNALTIPQQRQLVAHGIDLSDITPVMNLYTKNRYTYILMQGHPYAVSPLPGTTQWRVHAGELQGPVVTFNPARQAWEVTC